MKVADECPSFLQPYDADGRGVTFRPHPTDVTRAGDAFGHFAAAARRAVEAAAHFEAAMAHFEAASTKVQSDEAVTHDSE